MQRELRPNLSIEVAYVGSKITRVGLPDTNLNQLTVDQLALGAPLPQRVANPFFGTIPRSSSLGDPTIPVGAAAQAVPAVHHRQPVPQQRRHDDLPRRLRQARTAAHARAVVPRVSYTRSKLVDDASSVFDASILTGPVANYPVADSFNRKLERDYSTGDMPHVFVASAVWDLPFGASRGHGPAGVARRDRRTTGR